MTPLSCNPNLYDNSIYDGAIPLPYEDIVPVVVGEEKPGGKNVSGEVQEFR